MPTPKQISAKSLLAKHVASRDRVLLVNPPVEETRYSWIRWNQPLDLLKLAAHLRAKVGCKVELLDFMKPDSEGNVPEQFLPAARRYLQLGDHRYPMRRFGQPYSLLTDWVTERRAAGRRHEPMQVWVTSLCSYWFESVAQVCRVARQALPDAKIVLIGQYPRLLPDHARQMCAADLIVSDSVDLGSVPLAIDLYGQAPPPFVALGLDPKTALTEIKSALDRKIFDFTFFDDDLLREGGESLRVVVENGSALHSRVRFHLICGLNPSGVTSSVARILAHKSIAEFHVEEPEGTRVSRDVYAEVRSRVVEAGVEIPSKRLSGFVWIGKPGESLEHTIGRALHVVDCLGSFIPKPFTPTPGGVPHRNHAEYLERIPHQHWSPHLFPFSELNKISRGEYHDLYRLAAFLNNKVRGTAFDFLNGTLGSQFLRESLRREVWNFEAATVGATH